MSLPEHINLETAQAAYAVANTPVYLVKRLHADSNVRLLVESMPPDQILAEFKSSVARAPTSLAEIVVPYICLVALSLEDDILPLKKASGFVAAAEYKWIDYIRDFLIETYQSVSRTTIKAPAPLRGAITIQSNLSTSTVTLRVS